MQRKVSDAKPRRTQRGPGLLISFASWQVCVSQDLSPVHRPPPRRMALPARNLRPVPVACRCCWTSSRRGWTPTTPSRPASCAPPTRNGPTTRAACSPTRPSTPPGCATCCEHALELPDEVAGRGAGHPRRAQGRPSPSTARRCAPISIAASDPGRAGRPRLLIQIYPPGQDLEKPLPDRRWKASPATRMMELLHATGRARWGW